MLLGERKKIQVVGRFRQPISMLDNLYSTPVSAFATSVCIVFLVIAVIGPIVAPYGLNEQIASDIIQPPSLNHLFGTDHLGRDVFSRVLYGARDVLSLAGVGTLLAVALGTIIGLVSGYRGGIVDEVIMRLFDALLSLPALLLALLLLGSLGPSRNSIFLVIVVAYTPIVARVVRSETLAVKSKSFVEAARVQGEPFLSLVFWEILPSTLPALAVEASLRFSYAIFLVSSLGFLGVGVQPPDPDWGRMVSEGRNIVTQAPWAMYFPAVTIALVVVSVNLVADRLKKIIQGSTEVQP